MILLPAVDLMDGKCVRLARGDAGLKKEYSADPVDTARRFEESGADMIHVVDLDAALGRGEGNAEVLARIVKGVGVPVETGGGVRSLEDVARRIEAGAARVVLGTVAVERPAVVEEALLAFGTERVAVGIDARGGRVSVRGWLEQTDLEAAALALRMKALGVTWIVYTDIERDGMLSGPDIEGTRVLARDTGLKVIASGGIRSLEDVRALLDAEKDNVAGFITGRAVYEGKFTVREAAELVRRAREGKRG